MTYVGTLMWPAGTKIRSRPHNIHQDTFSMGQNFKLKK